MFGDDEPPTRRAFVVHAQLLEAAEMAYPIVLASAGAVMDGMHRAARTLRDRRPNVDAVQFPEDPPPDHMGRRPEELPY